MTYRNILLVLVSWTLLDYTQSADLDSVLSLSVLPLDKLLHVRRTLTQETDFDKIENTREGSNLPEALPLRNSNKEPKDKTFGESYFDEDWKEDPWKNEHWAENPWKDETSWKDQLKYKLKEKFKEHFAKFHHKKKKKKNKIQKIFQISITLLAFLAFGGYLVALVVQTIQNSNNTAQPTVITPVAQARIYRRDVHNRTDADLYMALTRLSEGYAQYNDHCRLY